MRIKILDNELYAEELASGGFGPRKPGDAGVDLRARTAFEVTPQSVAVIPLGVAIELPPVAVGWITGRSSSTLSFGLITHEGKIDEGYRGEIHAIVQATTRTVHIARGERVAQLLVIPIVNPAKWRVADELTESERGSTGLGSTGRV